MLNSAGPNTSAWGAPLVTDLQLELVPTQSSKKDLKLRLIQLASCFGEYFAPSAKRLLSCSLYVSSSNSCYCMPWKSPMGNLSPGVPKFSPLCKNWKTNRANTEENMRLCFCFECLGNWHFLAVCTWNQASFINSRFCHSTDSQSWTTSKTKLLIQNLSVYCTYSAE